MARQARLAYLTDRDFPMRVIELRWLIAVVGLATLTGCQSGESDGHATNPIVQEPATATVLVPGSSTTTSSPVSTAGPVPTKTVIPVVMAIPLPTLPPETGGMEATITGVLIERGDCLYLRPDPGEGRGDSFIVWPFGYRANREGDAITVRDSGGKIVAKAGTRIHMGGGAQRADGFDHPCRTDSLWIANVPIYIIDDSPVIYEEFDRPVATHSGTTTTTGDSISGYLLESGPCLWIISDDGYLTYQVVWPPGFSISRHEASMVVLDSKGEIVARVDERNTLHGGPVDASEFPPVCEGLVWLATEPIFPNYDGPPQ